MEAEAKIKELESAAKDAAKALKDQMKVVKNAKKASEKNPSDTTLKENWDAEVRKEESLKKE